MNVPLVKMEPDTAKAKLAAYRAQMHRAAEEQYRAAVAAYEALAEGKPVLSLQKAIQHGGVEPSSGLPRLAIARSDRQRVRCRWQGDHYWARRREHGPRFACFNGHGDPHVDPENWADAGLAIFVDMGRMHRRRRTWQARDEHGITRTHWNWRDLRGTTDVPMIPPEVREKVGKTALVHRPEYYILWEVEKWETEKQKPVPPADPFLLQPLGDMPTDLFAVVAEWDLTDLERLIMESL